MEKVFKTGESLSFSFEREMQQDFKVNLMLLDYPTYWNRAYLYDRSIKSNCNYSLYVTEISPAADDVYKVELINTDCDLGNGRYYLAGRFKFFLKKGDTLNFQYYDENNESEDYIVQSRVENLAYNTIELSFDKEIGIPKPFVVQNSYVGL